jgi:hypothetical protein
MIKVLFWIFAIWFNIYLGLVNYTHSNLLVASFLVGQGHFPDREFTLEVPNNGPAVIQRSKLLSKLTITMPVKKELDP